MFSKICAEISQNKNTLMLLSTGIYILALFAVLSGNLLTVSLLFTIVMIIFCLKNLFSVKHILIWVFIFYFGAINTSLRLKDTDELLDYAPVNSEIYGKIVTIPQGISDNKPKFFFDAEKLVFDSVEKDFKSEKALVTVNNKNGNIDFENLKLYSHLKLKGRLSMPFKAGNPSQFDYGNYLRNHNAYAVFYANEISVLESDLSLPEKFMKSINNYREEILAIHSKYLPSPNLEILGGIIFGDDAVSPPKNIKQSFVNSGLLHILAASGMNVAFIYAFFFLLMSCLRINYKIKVSMGMLTVIIYTLMTGLGASVIRAACMLLFVLAGKLIDRDAHSISLLSFVGLLMLIYNPLFINDVGFELSFVVTFGILIMAPAFEKTGNKIIDYIISAVSIPIIAQLWVIPIQIFYFNNISIYSVFANIMSVPIIMVLSAGGFTSSLLSVIRPAADLICKSFDFILNPLLTTLVNISDFWGKLPNAAIQTTHPSVIQIFLYYGVLLCISVFLYNNLRQKYFKQALSSIMCFIILLSLSFVRIENNNLEITAFDVGNADCFMIKTPANDYIMIDTGKAGYNGGKSQAEIIVLKYMKDVGIKNLDSIIVTHFDNDHSGGAADLINNLNVKNLYVNNLEHNSYTAKNIYDAAKKRNTKIIKSENQQLVYAKDGLKLVNYSNYSGKSDNDNSIITLLTYNDFTMLFTGDAGINGIKSVINELPKNITVLKAPHHGAPGGADKEIVNYFNPDYSLISTGENKFGHPSMYTLSLLRNSKILRTDIDNSVKFVVSGKKQTVMSYDINSRKYRKINYKQQTFPKSTK